MKKSLLKDNDDQCKTIAINHYWRSLVYGGLERSERLALWFIRHQSIDHISRIYVVWQFCACYLFISVEIFFLILF